LSQTGSLRASSTGALTSRLGRRFVLLFALCALLPLIVFATWSVTRVSDRMHADLGKTLHNAAKTSGMGIAARLGQVAGDLRLTADLVKSWRVEGMWSDGEALKGQVREHCESVWLFDGDRIEALVGDEPAPQLELSKSEEAHVARGLPLAYVGEDDTSLLMVLELDPDDDYQTRVIGRVRSQWFWDPQELRGVNCEFAACDRFGRVLFHTFRQLPRSQILAAGVTRQASSGSIEWQVDGEPHLGRYWHAFLQPQYGLDLWVVQSRSQADALGAVNSFVRSFWLTAACTLLCVVLGSLVQMRRTLDPIVSLRDATQRLGRGELDVRVWIESRDEFGELGRAFNDMATRLQENIARREQTERELVASRDAALAAVKAKAEFVTNVSHEFRTPMAEILGATEILTQIEDDDDASVREEFSGIALHGAKRLAQLLDDVLELGEATGGTMTSVDVQASVAAAIESMDVAVRERIRCRCDDDLPTVVGDGERLTETWCRLLDNAGKFSASSKPIEVDVRRDGPRVLVMVKDHGVGIAADDLRKVFEPFSQVGRDQMIDKAHGTGLGLTLAKAAVESHGGTIAVLSELGSGTTFQVSLPVEAAIPGRG